MATLQHEVAAATGPLTPTSDNAPWQGRVIGGQKEADGPNSRSAQPATQPQPAEQAEAAERTRLADKRLATIRAALALRGFELQVVDGGATGPMYQVRRWGQSRVLDDLADVQAFARQVGAPTC